MEQPPVGFWQWAAHAASAAAIALGAFIFKGGAKRVELLEARNTVTREELAKYIEGATDERRDMHRDNKLEFERLNCRIDRLYELRSGDDNRN